MKELFEITDEMIDAAIDKMPGDFEIISEDDNHYCSPPRTRLLRSDEVRQGVREMLEAAFKAVRPRSDRVKLVEEGVQRFWLSSDQFGQMILQATRYALGRRSFSVRSTGDALVIVWPHLSERWRDLIRRDIREALEDAHWRHVTLGDRCDHDVWVKLRDRFDEEGY